MAESFFIDEELDWWGDAETAAAVAVPQRARRRPPQRTLAGDLRRLRTGFERRSPIPAAGAGLVGLALLAALAVTLRLSLGGEDAPAPVSPSPATAAVPAPVTPGASAPADGPLLKPGTRGPRVRDLQVALTALGLHSGADGDYGAATAATVAAFQGASGLVADGISGPDTTAALREALAAHAEEDAAAAEAGIAAAEAAGRLSPAVADTAREAVSGTVEAIRTQAPGRGAVLGLVLHDVAAVADDYTDDRAALFEELRANVAAPPASPAEIRPGDVVDGAGVVYRYFPEHGYQFHPLASFARLTSLARRKQREQAARLAASLVARGVRSRDALLFHYRFPFGGPPIWTSGFAQAAAANGLGRTGVLVDDPKLVEAAAASFHAIERDLTLPVAGGDWIQEYSFSPMAVLNAQLQSLISLAEYAKLTGNEDAAAYAAGLGQTTKSVLGQFDTGCWSLYSLDGNPATAWYHAYHVQLLERLGRRTRDPVWREAGRRWRAYQEAGGC